MLASGSKLGLYAVPQLAPQASFSFICWPRQHSAVAADGSQSGVAALKMGTFHARAAARSALPQRVIQKSVLSVKFNFIGTVAAQLQAIHRRHSSLQLFQAPLQTRSPGMTNGNSQTYKALDSRTASATW
ncbi:hypothetical protein L1887_62006 [Cichorium endivia]|nr:hypothetical protein L1887_62006 [Cichorium endivia]